MAVALVRAGFWLQHASNEAEQLLTFADELGQTAAGRPGVALGPVNVPKALNAHFQRARRAGDAILDPHGQMLDLDPTKRSEKHFPWLALNPRPATQVQWQQWMQQALDHQLSAVLRGSAPPPSFVMTASPRMQAARGALELYPVLDAATEVTAQVPPGTDCWLSASVDRTYLREEPHLTRLANALLATGANGVVFRASHSQLPPVDDSRYLHGLREIVEACAENDVRLYLPNTGWVGWLAMGLGAWGFSGGMSATSWVDKVASPMRRPELPSLPYFEHQLLRSVPWRVHEQLVSEPGYQPCVCADCAAMGANHDLALAKRHQLRHAHEAGTALSGLPRAQRRAVVATRLDTAIAFCDGLSSAVAARIDGNFLDRWRALV
jgi:hypothetical protein